jgi:hypothetical protein
MVKRVAVVSWLAVMIGLASHPAAQSLMIGAIANPNQLLGV